MTFSLIPETAPFDEEQRAWLNGFFAGLTNMPSNGVPEETLAGIQALANGAGTAVEVEEEDFPWHDPALDLEERLKLAENKPVERQLMAAMAQLDCGACGYVCQTYSEAIANGEEKSLTLCSPGGKETAKQLKKLVKSKVAPATNGAKPSTNGSTANGAVTTIGYGRGNPFAAKMIVSRNLNGMGSAKHTSHVEIDLSGSGLTYEVGDSLGVYPVNCDLLVRDVLSELGVFENASIDWEGSQLPASLVMCEKCDLNECTDELLELLISNCDSAEAKARLENWLEDGVPDGVDVLELLQQTPFKQLDLAEFMSTLAAMQPRLYSISSSLNAHPEKVHLTIGRVSWERANRLRKGVASTMFSDRLRESDTVRVFVQKSHGFRLPADDSAPVIMVGPGTGIAPFRAFLQERSSRSAPGDNWLFFGDQNQSSDFLYETELQELIERKTLTRLDLAFSRDQEEKVYVQDRMRENSAELFQWLKNGGYFYVCGDAKRMAVDVDNALREVIAEHCDDAQSAEDFFEELKSAGRYLRDVY